MALAFANHDHCTFWEWFFDDFLRIKAALRVFVVLRGVVIDGRENNVSNLIITIKELFLSEGLKLSVRIISELIPLPPMTKREGVEP